MRKFVVILLLILALGCNTKAKTNVNISNIDVTVKAERFEVDFYNSTAQSLPATKEKYPMLFPHNIDSVWVNKINNKDEKALFEASQKLYKSFSSVESELEELFKYLKYYNPKFEVPTVITMLTNMESRVVCSNEYLFISLDSYLGINHDFYVDYAKYIRQKNTKNHLIVDVASEYINKQIPPNRERRFLDKMIYEGKKMYLLDAYLPNVQDVEKIGYTLDKFDWAEASEENIWRYFIEKDLLYSTDTELNKRFLDISPFSKFYLGEDKLSPGQIGVYIGWQIVRSYMQNNDVSLPELIAISEEEIFTKSKYKPKR